MTNRDIFFLRPGINSRLGERVWRQPASPEYANEMAGVMASPWKRLKGGPNKKLLRASWPAFFISSLGAVLAGEMFKNRLALVDRRSIRETTD